jgi:hypothetical protein
MPNTYKENLVLLIQTGKTLTWTKLEHIWGVLIYMGLVNLPEIDYYFLGDFCVCPIVRQAMTMKRFRWAVFTPQQPRKQTWTARRKF